jgi:cytochrome c peroxidase
VKCFAGTVILLSAVVGVAMDTAQVPPPYTLNVPHGFPRPRIPADNPMTPSKVELGRRLFYDTRLSGNGQQSCASCHEQARAFTDGKARAVGSTGEVHPRGAMSLVNVAYASTLTWGDPTKTRLEDQVLVPMFGEHPVELGLEQPGTTMVARLQSVEVYRHLFSDAFPGEADAFTVPNVTRALASFERTIISGRSSYDRYHYDRDETAISPAARRGEQLFFSQPLSCFRCHNGFNFSGATDFDGRHEGGTPEYHNTGLYNVAGLLSYPRPNTGMYEVTHRPEDVGKFKAPTLRNIAVTAPYMHDGSIETLGEALDHYAAGGRTIAEGPTRGIGHDNPNKSPLVKGFPLTAEQKADLIAFLITLTDNDLLNDTRFANPWTAPHQEAR